MIQSSVKIAFIFHFLLSSLSAYAQEDLLFSGAKHRVGFQIGRATAYQLKRTYEYDATLYQIQYFRSIASTKNLGIDLLAQPQFNLTKYRYTSTWPSASKDIELGINIGIVLRANLFSDFLGLYAAGSIGPHYLSGAPKRQARGFIFSDNVFVGMNIKVIQNFYFDLRVGLRHISNAGLLTPNAGINNFIFSLGILVNLKDVDEGI